MLDPGPDFDLSTDDDLEILRRLGELRIARAAALVSLSRKDFLGAILAGSWEERAGRRPSAAPARSRRRRSRSRPGPSCFRLHDAEALDAMRVAAAIADPRARGRGRVG